MANDYFANTSDLTAVANAIRSKGGTSGNLTFPSGFVSAIQDIKAGTEEKTGNVTLTAFSENEVSVNCGFKPDLLFIRMPYQISGYAFCSYAGCVFSWPSTEDFQNTTHSIFKPHDLTLHMFEIQRTSTGFSIKVNCLDLSTSETINGTFTYEYFAIKYT